jgi:hypothetical protein
MVDFLHFLNLNMPRFYKYTARVFYKMQENSRTPSLNPRYPYSDAAQLTLQPA